MNIQISRHQILESPAGRPFSYDLFLPETPQPAPFVLFIHGFKGFKDWGCWDLVASYFADRGYGFCKFNFSHNGTTPEFPQDFANLEAYGNNTYSKEFSDLRTLLTHLRKEYQQEIDWNRCSMIGHSRGGALALAWVGQDPTIANVITWAAVDRLSYAWKTDQFIREWRDRGVYHVQNSRTKQSMPLYYSLYEDFIANQDLFDLEQIFDRITLPTLILHGDGDTSVPFSSAESLAKSLPHAQLQNLQGANHVFGGSHPYSDVNLPQHMKEACAASVQFLDSNK